MTPAELLSAVRARLDETEGWAAACTTRSGQPPPPWRAGIVYGTVITAAGDPVARTESEVYATHIALHDPAAVLRRVAADRRVLQRHKPVDARVVGYSAMERGICADCSNAAECFSGDFSPLGWEIEDDDKAVEWPCVEFADLADRAGIDLEETPQ